MGGKGGGEQKGFRMERRGLPGEFCPDQVFVKIGYGGGKIGSVKRFGRRILES